MRNILVTALALALLGTGANHLRAELVTNGSFATGDLSNWSASDGSIGIDTGFAAPSDTYDAAFGGSGILSQNLATTAGINYLLQFSVLDDSPLFSDTFKVSLGGFSAVITGLEAAGYLAASFSVPGTDIAGADTLSFQGASDFGDWHLDDVSVTVDTSSTADLPEPASGALLITALVLGGLTGRLRRAARLG